MTKPRTLILSEVQGLIADGLGVNEMRDRLGCRALTLRNFMMAHDLRTLVAHGVKAKAAIAYSNALAEMRIPMGKGGDVEFARLMGGRTYDRIRFANDYRAPIHMPHRIPGDNFSPCGSSMLHNSGGSTGSRVGVSR